MATNERFDESVSRWLEESAPARLPERVLNATFERTRTSRQHVGWRALLGRIQRNRFVPALAGAAVVVIAAGLALSFYANQTGIGGPAIPSPTASQSLAAQPPTASPSDTYFPVECADFGARGGTYDETLGTIRATATVPDGWHGLRDTFYLTNAECIGGVNYSGSVRLEISLVDQVYVDACAWRDDRVDADTPADVTAALAAQEGHATTGTTDTTLGGYPAKRFEISVPADLDTSTCDEGGPIYLWPDAGASGRHRVPMAPNQTATVYVVDVDGSAIGVAAGPWREDATAAEIAELDAVIDSLRFEP